MKAGDDVIIAEYKIVGTILGYYGVTINSYEVLLDAQNYAKYFIELYSDEVAVQMIRRLPYMKSCNFPAHMLIPYTELSASLYL